MEKTSFVTHNWLYRYNCLPFGLKQEPATFGWAMYDILATVKWQHVLVYLGDIMILSLTFGSHSKHVKCILRLINEVGMELKLEKCYLSSNAIDYFGRVATPGRLRLPQGLKTLLSL